MRILKYIHRNIASLEYKKQIWTKLASNMIWQKYPQEILPTNFNNMQWYKNGQLNMAENCLAKNIQNLAIGDSPAIYYSNFTTDKQGFVTYKQLNKRVRKFVDVLQHLQINKDKRVLIYMPNIIEAAEAILACCALGVVFESQHYGVGMIQLKESLKSFDPHLIITASCSVDQDGIHQNQFYINRAREELNRKNQQCLIIQREEKKVLELGEYDYDYSKIEIESPSKYIKYENLDSNYPLYTFNTYLNIDDRIVQNRVYRETGPFSVGLNYSMMRTLGIFQQSKILCLAHLSSTLGLSYMLFGPLLRGASTFFVEDPLTFSTKAANYLQNNKIRTLYIHSNLLQRIFINNQNFLGDSKVQSLFIYGNMNDKLMTDLQKTNKKVDNFFFTRAFYNTELGVIAGANDWTNTTSQQDSTYTKTVDKLEYKLKANKDDIDELCIRVDSYPGIFTRFFDQQTQSRFQHYYFTEPMYLNTFLPVSVENDGRLKVLRRSEEESPYKLISGIKFIKKQIANDIQMQIKKLKDLYFLPLQNNQEDNFVFFIEIEDCTELKQSQENLDQFYKKVKDTISSSIGDVFEIENIFFFETLPKKEINGKIKINHQRLRKLLDESDKKFIEGDQDVFDFDEFERQAKKSSQQLNKNKFQYHQ